MPKISAKLLLIDSVFLLQIPDTLKNPSNLPQNRFKCFRRIFMPEAKIIALRCLKMRF